jgi:hypothetical protein
MLLNMVQHPRLRGSLAIKINPPTVKTAFQLLKYQALARQKFFMQLPCTAPQLFDGMLPVLIR